MKIICLDTETTGTNIYRDEVLQLCIIDGDGAVLFNEYFKPLRKESWHNTEYIHHISPKDVKNCHSLLFYKDEIQSILKSADIIVGYNLIGFDLPFLFRCGIDNDVKDGSVVVDVMLAFAPIYGEWNSRMSDYKWKKLIDCAEYYSYEMENQHNALCDSKATLHCFYSIFGNPPSIPNSGDGIFPSNSTPAPEKSSDLVINKKPKTGRIMIFFGFNFLLGFFGVFNPVCLVFAALLLYFGFKRHKKYKEWKKSNEPNVKK